jgi:hypothetical protein
MSQLLESRWSETKDALLEGLQGNPKSCDPSSDQTCNANRYC